MSNNTQNTEEIVLEDNQILCVLTGVAKKTSSKEENLQSTIRMLNEEYGFDLTDMERDFAITFVDPETGKNKKQKVELVIFDKGTDHVQENIIRIATVQDDKTKENDKKKGVRLTLENAMAALDKCEFGLWTNGIDIKYLQREDDDYGFDYKFSDLSDIPGFGEDINDLERPERSHSRKPANDSLIKVFKRSHDYIYGNEGRKKDAFWQLLYLIFCKLYDEKRRFTDHEKGISYRKKFWVGVKEQNTNEGRKAVADRIKSLFAIQNAFGDLLPEDKVNKVKEIKSGSGYVAFVGDGVNDAPVVALSDVGIAMGGLGSDATIETADVVIQDDRPSKIPMAINIGKQTKKIVWQNIILAFAVKAVVLILGAGGLATMWDAVFADVGVALLAILNAVRIQNMKF